MFSSRLMSSEFTWIPARSISPIRRLSATIVTRNTSAATSMRRGKDQQHEDHHPVAGERVGKRGAGLGEDLKKLDLSLTGQVVVLDKDPLDTRVESVGIGQVQKQQQRPRPAGSATMATIPSHDQPPAGARACQKRR